MTIRTSKNKFAIREFFEAEFVPADLFRVYMAMARVQNVAEFQIHDHLPWTMATKFVYQIIQNINSQRYSFLWSEYNARYRAWKEKWFPWNANRFWVLKGDLMKNLTVKRSSHYGWFAGIPAGIKDTGGKSWYGKGQSGKRKYIGWYGWIMEHGAYSMRGGFQLPRPLFGPTFNDFLPEADRMSFSTLKYIGEQWR